MSSYRSIVAERDHYPVRRLCQVLSVPASGFYAWPTSSGRLGTRRRRRGKRRW